MTKLRQRMIEDMQLRGLAEYYAKSPDQISKESYSWRERRT